MSDLDLLEQLCSSEEDDALYTEFVRRFFPDVKAECRRKCVAQRLDNQVGDQFAHEVFERVRQYKTFRRDKIRLSNDRKAIIVYLNRVATRLFLTYHNRENRQEVEHRTYFDDLRDESRSAIDAKDLKNQKDVALNILKRLNPKEQKVLLADIDHKRHQKYLPDDITMELAQQLNVKPDTLRKIRQRVKEKLQKAIDEINQA